MHMSSKPLTQMKEVNTASQAAARRRSKGLLVRNTTSQLRRASWSGSESPSKSPRSLPGMALTLPRRLPHLLSHSTLSIAPGFI